MLDRFMVSNVSKREESLLRNDRWYTVKGPLLPWIDLRYQKSRGEGHQYLGIAWGNHGLTDLRYPDTSDSDTVLPLYLGHYIPWIDAFYPCTSDSEAYAQLFARLRLEVYESELVQ